MHIQIISSVNKKSKAYFNLAPIGRIQFSKLEFVSRASKYFAFSKLINHPTLYILKEVLLLLLIT